MAVVGKFYLDKQGMGRYLRQSRDLYRCVHLRARQGAALARALAPRDSGIYKSSIHVESGRSLASNQILVLAKASPGRGIYDGRVMAVIVADAAYAVQVEHGRRRTKTYKGARVMARMARTLNTPQRARRA
jgi:hypothetical protein